MTVQSPLGQSPLGQSPLAAPVIELAGVWTLTEATDGAPVPMTVPGDVHTALQVSGRIPDPYLGRNEYDLRWVADRDWRLTRDFEDAGQRRILVCEGLDTVAEVLLNGETVLTAANAFRAHAIEVTTRRGANRIEIRLASTTAAADALQAAQPFRVPYHAGNCPIPNGNMLRKPQCDFGWDWNIALCPVGVTGRVALVAPGAEVGEVAVTQRHAGSGVTVTVAARLHGAVETASAWRVAICEAVAQGSLPAGAREIRAEQHLDAPDLWQPNGLGAPTTHPLTVEIGAARRETPVALRDVRLVSEPDAAGRSFGLSVNGVPVFARGANWIPADALPGRITEEKTRALLASAQAANLNMIRVWGGGRYEPASFYEACDSLGLLVWQDFMFACHLYPCDDAFLAEVEREVAYQAPRIGHHVALWCGDNELLGALGWFEESRANRDRYLVAYDRLNRTIERALKAARPDANWWPSSPSPGPMSFGDAWHADGAGDMHFWSVWHEGRDFEHYRDVKPRFCSEFGFQSYPSIDVIRSFAGPADLNIASPVMESHQKNAGGNARIAETMFRYFRFPKDFESFVWLSQIQQGVAIRTAVDYWRSLKPHCMGALYWQLNDAWPVASWSSLDHGGGWKLLHHMARRFFQPVAVAAIPEAGGFRITAVNDTAAPVEIALTLDALTLDGARRPLATLEAPAPTDRAVTLAEVAADALRPGEILALAWRASNGMTGEDLAPLVRWKALDLPDPALTLETKAEDGGIRARITAARPAFFVTLEADRPGRFSDNALSLAPGRPVEIRFTPHTPGDARLSLRDLRSATA